MYPAKKLHSLPSLQKGSQWDVVGRSIKVWLLEKLVKGKYLGGRQILFYSSPTYKVNVMAWATLAILQ